MMLRLSFLFLLLMPFSHGLHFPRGEKIEEILKPGEIFHFVEVLHAGTSFKVDVNASSCNALKKDRSKARWEIKGSNCYQGFGKSLNLFHRKTSFRISHPSGSHFQMSNFNQTSEGDEIFCGQKVFSIARNNGGKIGGNASIATTTSLLNNDDETAIAVTPFDGVFLFSLSISGGSTREVTISLQVKGPHGYLSRTELPLLYVHLITAILLLLSLLFFFSSYLVAFDKPSTVHIALTLLAASEFLKNIICAFIFYRSVKAESSDLHLVYSSIVFGCLADALFRCVFLLLTSGLGQVSKHNFNLGSSLCLGLFYFLSSVFYESFSLQNGSDYAAESFLLVKYIVDSLIAYSSMRYMMQTWENLKHNVVCSVSDKFFRFLTVVKICVVLVVLLHLIVIWSLSSTICDIGWFLSWFQVAVWSALRLVFVIATAIVYNTSTSWDLMSQGTMLKATK